LGSRKKEFLHSCPCAQRHKSSSKRGEQQHVMIMKRRFLLFLRCCLALM